MFILYDKQEFNSSAFVVTGDSKLSEKGLKGIKFDTRSDVSNYGMTIWKWRDWY